MDGHDLIIQLLPAAPLIRPHRGAQIEAFHLFHTVAHWLVAPIAAIAGVWSLCLVLSLAAWCVWGVVWLLRWPVRASRSALKAPEIS